MQIKSVYAKYIAIDFVGLHPISGFLGVSITRDRARRQLSLSQSGYIKRVSAAREGKFQPRDTPVGQTKSERDRFLNMKCAESDDDACDKSEYLSVLGEYGWVTGMTRGDQ